MSTDKRWWNAPKNEVHGKVIEYVQKVEQDAFDFYDRFVKLAALYDPNGAVHQDGIKPQGFISENVVASNVDTVTAIISTVSLRARIMTDDGDWQQQRQARAQELYAAGLEKLYDVETKAITAFGQGPGVRGTGLMYVNVEAPVYKDGKLVDGQLCVEHVLADDIVVPDTECRDTPPRPRQIHRRKLVDRDELKAKYPKHAEAIDKAQGTGTSSNWVKWADYRPLHENEVVVIHSHCLGIGEKGKPGHAPGRECITIDGATLLDAEWTEDYLPYARIVWGERPGSYFGISLAERIVGHQQVLNNSNYQIDRLVNLNAMPTIFVSMADADLAKYMSVQRPGTIVPLRGGEPKAFTPPAISPEVYKRVADVKVSASEESGVNRMIQHGTKPAGLDSGAALREYKDSTTQRFATQEKAYEAFRRDIVILMLAACKRLGRKAPTITQKTRFGVKRITWSKVDLKDIKVQISMASGLPRTVAGRTQLVLEWAQAGLIDTEESRRLLRHPDIERSLSLFTAGVEALEHAFDLIADGEVVMPEPFMHLQACVKRGQQQYLEWWRIGAPEEVMEAIRQFVVQAADMLEPKPMPGENAAPMPAAMPGDPMAAAPANANMPMPAEGPPQAALAAQAMNLRAV